MVISSVNKRLLSEYSSFFMLFCIVLFFYFRFRFVALLLYLLWYLMFGMVGLAYFCSTQRILKLSNFLLKISIPVTLLPFRKAFYYWTKAVNVILVDSTRVSEAYDTARKVNPDSLYTDNNKCMYFSFIAAVIYDIGEKEKALYYLTLAQQLPHKTALDENLKQLYEKISESNK